MQSCLFTERDSDDLNLSRCVCVPILPVDLVGCEGVVKHQDLVCILQPRARVVLVLQLHGGVQQGQVAADDQGVGAVCGDSSRPMCACVCLNRCVLLVCDED